MEIGISPNISSQNAQIPNPPPKVDSILPPPSVPIQNQPIAPQIKPPVKPTFLYQVDQKPTLINSYIFQQKNQGFMGSRPLYFERM